MTHVVPAILATTKEDFEEKLRAVEPYADRIHLDVADGIFVPTMTIGADDIAHLETSSSFLVHLMVSKPEHHVVAWLQSDTIMGIAFQTEATDKHMEIITKVKEADRTVGVVMNPETQFSEIESFVDAVDFVQFMTVKPGAYGGAFMPEVIEKIKDFHYFYPDKEIIVDGGINPETIPLFAGVGVSTFVSGSYIFKGADIKKAIDSLNKSLL